MLCTKLHRQGMRLAGKASQGRQRAGKSNEETVEKIYRRPWFLPVVFFCGRSCDMTTSSKFVQKKLWFFWRGMDFNQIPQSWQNVGHRGVFFIGLTTFIQYRNGGCTKPTIGNILCV
jgi:hypothetical protein